MAWQSPLTHAAAERVPLDALVDATPDGLLAFDRDCRYTLWNRAMERIAGMSSEQVVGRLAWEVFPFLKEEGEDAFFHAALAGEVRRTGHRRFHIPESGREGYFRGEYGPLRDRAGGIVGGIAVIRETTEERRNEELLSLQGLILDSMREGVSVSDEDGIIVYTNPAENRMFGYPAGALIGRHVTILNNYPPEENARVVAEVIRRLREDGAWEGEWQNVRSDGSPFVTRARITALQLADRPHWVCVQEDVTARLAADEERSRLVARARFLADASTALSASLSLQDTLRTVARLATPIVADWCLVEVIRPDGIPELTAVGHFDQAEENRAREVFARVPFDADGASGAARVIRTRQPELDSSLMEGDEASERGDALRRLGVRSTLTVPLHVHGRTLGAITLAQGSSGRAFSAADLPLAEEMALRAAVAIYNARLYEEARSELARREAAEASLRHRFGQIRVLYEMTEAVSRAGDLDEVYEQALDGLRDGLAVERSAVLLLDGEGVMRFVAWRGLSDGYRAAVEGHSPWAADDPDPAPVEIRDVEADATLAPALRETVLGEGIRGIAFIPLCFGGRLLGKFMLYSSQTRALAEDEMDMARAVARTIGSAIARRQDERSVREARAAAEAASRAKSEFLANMSHELRTPLNAIGGYAELLEMGIRGQISELQREDLQRIQQSQRHLLGLINEVLNYTRLETGTVQFDIQDVSAAEALAEAQSLVAPQARAKGLRLRVEGCPQERVVRADGEKLRQILVNLLGNAVKFTDQGGLITLSCAADEDTVLIRVADTGCGIPEDRLGAIFDPFVQVRSDLTRVHEGTGLGLAISRDLARGMDGELIAHSTPGEGSTFILSLPRAEPSPAT